MIEVLKQALTITSFVAVMMLVWQWKDCSAARGILATAVVLFMLGLLAGQVGPPQWNWIRTTLLLLSAVGLSSVLLDSSIVQDGHGMLPLLAHSRRSFLGIKLVNFVAGLLVGSGALLFKV